MEKAYVTPEDIMHRYRSMRTPPGIELIISWPGGRRYGDDDFVDLAIGLVQLCQDSMRATVVDFPRVPVALNRVVQFDLRDDDKARDWNDRLVFDLFVSLASHQIREWLVLEDGRYIKRPHAETHHPEIGKETP